MAWMKAVSRVAAKKTFELKNCRLRRVSSMGTLVSLRVYWMIAQLISLMFCYNHFIIADEARGFILMPMET